MPILNDLGFFMQENGEHKKSIVVFKEVLKQMPNRMVAHLNIADSYWETGQHDLAREHYSRYCSLMKTNNKENRTPDRAVGRGNY